MPDRWVTGSFEDRERAERAYQELERRGYKRDDVHMAMSDDARQRHFHKDDKSDLGNKALEGTGAGAAIGGVVGATVTAIAAAASAIAIPGIGLVIAGPIAGALAGAGAGAAAGGVAGALIGAGIPEDRAQLYERDIQEGRIMMGVRPRDDNDAQELEREWKGYGRNVYA
jgi:hypothetical protein